MTFCNKITKAKTANLKSCDCTQDLLISMVDQVNEL